MIETMQFIAALCCTIFSGAAIYISLVEHPARMSCGTEIAARQWSPSYRRAVPMQASLAIVSFVCGVIVWLLSGSFLWLAGAVLIGSVIPITFLLVMPVNKQLQIQGRELASEETQVLLVRWGKLHAIRSLLSLVASVIYIVLLVSD